MRRMLVAGNWKMNGSLASIEALIEGMKAEMPAVSDNCGVAVCPPALYLSRVKELVAGSKIQVGTQNIGDQDSGAYTGELAGSMIAEMGCQYTLVGHSERRSLYGESDELVAKRFAAARRHNLTPVLCIGELLEERESGNTESVVSRQLEAVISLEGIDALADCVVAYEPVWAIGTGKTASPEQAQEVHAFIRNKIRQKNSELADNLIIQYGGSVNAGNAAELFAMEDIDGGLIGGASLKAEDFMAICKAGK
ncbi:Triosephosphate isomerase [hydrothermal vent metagenome]|uniref:triose-phosphate isomerase n=1 Tax=hydrothermal vent metagenome TaxID=652676 RepID=A0A3B0ZQ57_9ZZZZ